MPSDRSDQRDTGDIAEKLGELLRLDVDAISGYDEAIEKAETQDVRSHLSTYRDDHQRHVNELTQLIDSKGLTPAKQPRGALTEGTRKLHASKGDQKILRAMHDIEEITNRIYNEASRESSMPPDAAELIERNLSDERRHLQWIDQELSGNLARHAAM